VRLHICLVNSWEGEVKGLEDQATAWLSVDEISKIEDSNLQPILPATLPILEKLKNIL
jgi:8-oxo-dGTP diphosphatase